MPSPPQIVEVIAKTSRVVNISWAPGFNGNSDILNYTVEISTDNQTFAQAACPGLSSSGCVVSSSFRNASLVGLHPGRTYYIRVFATNNVGSSTASSVITTTTDEEGIMLHKIFVASLAWKNTQHSAKPPPLVSPKMTAEILPWWQVTTQIWVVLLIGCVLREFASAKHWSTTCWGFGQGDG